MSSLRSAFLVAVLLTGCASPAVPDDDDSSPDPEQTVHVVTIDAADSVVERSDGTGFDLADGWAFQDWSRSFYAEHGDDYDFLLVFTDFLIPGFWQFAWTAKIDVGGIGIAEQNLQWYGEGLGADYTADAGSAGRLQALVVMNSLELWQQSWLTAQDILTHEVGHRWGMATRLPWEADETLLLDGHGHWTLVLGQEGPSAMSYGQTTDLGAGRFHVERVAPMPYGPLDLYNMGLLDPADVGELFHVRDPVGFDPAGPTAADLTPGTPTDFEGQRVAFSIDDVIAAMGPRVPSFADSQREFSMAFLLICRPGEACDPDTIAAVDAERAAWPATFDFATGGRGSVTTELAP